MLESASQGHLEQLHENIQISHLKNAAIQKRLISIFGKFEKLMHFEQRVNSQDTQKRDMLLEAQESMIKKISNPICDSKEAGLHIQLQNISTQLSQVQNLKADIE